MHFSQNEQLIFTKTSETILKIIGKYIFLLDKCSFASKKLFQFLKHLLDFYWHSIFMIFNFQAAENFDKNKLAHKLFMNPPEQMVPEDVEEIASVQIEMQELRDHVTWV